MYGNIFIHVVFVVDCRLFKSVVTKMDNVGSGKTWRGMIAPDSA